MDRRGGQVVSAVGKVIVAKQNRMPVSQHRRFETLAGLVDYRERMCRGFGSDGAGVGAIRVEDQVPDDMPTVTQALFDDIQRSGTLDDLLFHATAIKRGSSSSSSSPNSGVPVRLIRNGARSLARAGRLKANLPSSKDRLPVTLSGVVTSQTLSLNRIYDLTGSWSGTLQLTLPAGSAAGDQVDLSTENNQNQGLPALVMKNDLGATLYTFATPSSNPCFFTAIWTLSGIWQVIMAEQAAAQP